MENTSSKTDESTPLPNHPTARRLLKGADHDDFSSIDSNRTATTMANTPAVLGTTSPSPLLKSLKSPRFPLPSSSGLIHPEDAEAPTNRPMPPRRIDSPGEASSVDAFQVFHETRSSTSVRDTTFGGLSSPRRQQPIPPTTSDAIDAPIATQALLTTAPVNPDMATLLQYLVTQQALNVQLQDRQHQTQERVLAHMAASEARAALASQQQQNETMRQLHLINAAITKESDTRQLQLSQVHNQVNRQQRMIEGNRRGLVEDLVTVHR